MAELNLLPQKIRQARTTRKVVILGGVLLLGISGGLGGLFWYTNAALAGVKSEIQTASQVVTDKSIKEGKNSEATSAQQDIDTVQRIVALNTLSTGEVNWPKSLQLVGSLLTSTVQLTTYSYAIAPTGISLQVAGQAGSTVSFAAFIRGLQANSAIKTLSVSSYTYQPATASVGFTIALTLDPAAVSYATLITPKSVK